MLDALVSADSGRRRAAVAAVCSHAITINAVVDPVVVRALGDYGLGLSVADGVLGELKALQEQADDQYFERADRDGADLGRQTLAAFARARALSSVLFAVGDDSVAAACESIYESISSVDDRAEAIAIAVRELRSDQS
ncbi:hypothetical protein [Stenotrophomonas sp. PS02289]|uniref:hypothetical protein n=1 Tax=Stenotrophomonas sp. PS02289 TaxID=2991422 RepID=UPI00249A1F37|nr:hypothetical protein [Stenotrophomonas sp. PS02289]